jgi:hypothetical protein
MRKGLRLSEQRKWERVSKNRTSTDDEDVKSRVKTESRHSLEGRRRTPLSEVFLEIQNDSPVVSVRGTFPFWQSRRLQRMGMACLTMRSSWKKNGRQAF